LIKVNRRSCEIALTLRGMRGASCAERVRQTVNCLPGIENVFVNVDLALVSVRFQSTVVTPAMIKQAIRKVGFEAFDRISNQHIS
jgi:copper chaperone CopZ